MDLLTAFRVIIRQWLVFVIALVMAGGAVLALDATMQPTYSANATVLLLPPRAGGVHQQPPANDSKNTSPKLINPYLSFDSTIYVLARIVIEDLTTDESKLRLSIGGSQYEMAIKPDTPMIVVTAIGHNQRDTLATRDAVVSAVGDDLMNRQRAAGVPEDTWVTIAPVSRPETANKTSDKLKVLAAVLALGVVAALGLVFVAEGLTTGRRGRAHEALAGPAVRNGDNSRFASSGRSLNGWSRVGGHGPEGLPERSNHPEIDVKDSA